MLMFGITRGNVICQFHKQGFTGIFEHVVPLFYIIGISPQINECLITFGCTREHLKHSISFYNYYDIFCAFEMKFTVLFNVYLNTLHSNVAYSTLYESVLCHNFYESEVYTNFETMYTSIHYLFMQYSTIFVKI